jgi:hypothetical protein
MRERYYQMEELQRAREIQEEAAKMHMVMPVLSWSYEILDENGKIEEKGIGKANSFTRNALNAIAWFAAFADWNVVTISYFGDGFLSCKNTLGDVKQVNGRLVRRDTTAGNPILLVGTSTAAESLDDYEIATSSLTPNATSMSTAFNTITRKLVTTVSRSFFNGTASPINITESGITVSCGTSPYYDILFVHDVFDPITVEPGKTLNRTYVVEVAYPA